MNSFQTAARRLALLLLVPCFLSFAAGARAGQTSITYEGKDGPGKGKHVVFLSGDEEYRSEEGLPMLAKILSQRHGFKCTVLFALDPDGTINPNNNKSLPDAEALDSADAIVMLLRWRAWPDDQMKHFVDAFHRGVPIVALRTATHAFNFPGGTYKDYNSFGKRVLGEQWVNHWGRHKSEATRAVVEPGAAEDPVMRGVADVFGTTDVYEAYPPADAKILFRGQVLKGMNPADAPADYKKKRSTDKQEQGVNDPMMAVAWTRVYKNEAGKENRILCTTMGAASDLVNEGLRRLVVNGVYWGLGLDVPAKADVAFVDDYHPSMYGFNGFRKGIKPEDHALGVVLKEGTPAAVKPAAQAAPRTPAGGAVVRLAADVKVDVKADVTAGASESKGEAAKPQAAAGNTGGPLVLKKADHIAILGNTLADRLQHDGYLETLVYARFPQLNLVVRNLSAAGDEVATWHRSENFGSRDDWLKKVQADVIWAFYGFNESSKGPEGLAKFKADLDKFIKDVTQQNYSGKAGPRLVLFSPIANEKLADPNMPDPSANNANIQLYARAMAEVAKADGVQFVDLYALSQKLYADAAKAGKPLTINTLHLSEAGDKVFAPEMFRAVFDESPPDGDFEKLRAAVNEKSAQWHGRYRTVDGYNVYGGRSKLSFESGKGGPKVSNYQIMQEEMAQRDVMTANRDKAVWAAAQGKEVQVADDNLPPVEKIGTNKPGPNPDGSYNFLNGEEAISRMKVPAHCKVNLFASEEQFPELVNPVQMAWDTKGRLWVAAWPNYPERTPTSTVGDSILIFEDTKGTGRADKVTHFLDNLNCPTGFQFYKDGILLMQAPDLWFARDTKGDGKADSIERVLMGMDSADSHHTTNSMCYEPGGAVFLSDGVFHRTQVETADGPVRNEDACIYRFEPKTGKFERYAPYGFANPHGRVFDYWGNDIITDATGNASYFGPALSGHLDYPAKHPALKQFWARPSRPCPGTNIMTSRHFPEEYWGNFLDCNVIGFQGIYRVKVADDGAGLAGTSLEDLISSTDPNFRPTGVSVGPDGALYVMDWHNPLIGHMQHNMRDPNRNHTRGRIYRITYEGRPLVQQPKIDGQPIPALLDLLKAPEDHVRTLAKIELDKHPTAEVIPALKGWVESLDQKDPAYQHHLTEALWVHQWLNVVDVDLLKKVLRSPDPHARAAATRVLCYWRDRVPEAVALVKAQADDENPQVRLEAVRAASFFRTPDAADAALEVLKAPTDYYLDYVLKETMRALDPYWRKAVAEGHPVAVGNVAAAKYLGQSISTPDLLKMPRTLGTMEAILARPDVADATRTEVLNAIAAERKSSRASALYDAVVSTGQTDPAGAGQIARLLPQQPPTDLKPFRDRLATLARQGKSAPVREAAWAAAAMADNSFDTVYAEASKSPASLIELLNGIPMIYDADIRSLAYDKVAPLLAPDLPPGLPGDLNSAAGKAGAVKGRFVRIELPRQGTLSLAEVQVFSDGKNVALGAKAKQSSTAFGGAAGRAVDGNTSGTFGSGTITHTHENEIHPWWEVDLGAEKPIQAVAVWNRTDGNGEYVKRLDGFTLTILDSKRQEAFKKVGLPAPAESVRVAVTSDEVGDLRRAAIKAAVSMSEHQADTFKALVALVKKGEQMTAAARGIRSLPRRKWDKDLGGQAAEALVAWAKTVPAGDRTEQDYLEAVQFAGDLVSLLPPERAEALRKDLRDLRVAVFVVGTVREQMRYDTPRLVTEAGKPFEIIFENSDFMPHNLTVVKPGTRAAVGNATATMRPDDLDAEGRPFIPKDPAVKADILAATKLLENGQKQALKLTAPSAEGDYDYVCTYPGHWELMWGRLVVTKDVDAYLQAHPEAALPATAPAAAHNHTHAP